MELEQDQVTWTPERKRPRAVFKTDPNQTVRPSLKVRDVDFLIVLLQQENREIKDQQRKTRQILDEYDLSWGRRIHKSEALGWTDIQIRGCYRSQEAKRESIDQLRQRLHGNNRLLKRLKRVLWKSTKTIIENH